ncbi:MAG: hypothetical protein ACFFD8_07275 [Candidatus Thorarchaeota archaeon]
MSGDHWLINATMRRVALKARGPAISLAKGLLEQIPQFMSAGMSVETAVRESLLIAIRSAQLRARHCVGSERYALDDFIDACLKMESQTEHLIKV